MHIAQNLSAPYAGVALGSNRAIPGTSELFTMTGVKELGPRPQVGGGVDPLPTRMSDLHDLLAKVPNSKDGEVVHYFPSLTTFRRSRCFTYFLTCFAIVGIFTDGLNDVTMFCSMQLAAQHAVYIFGVPGLPGPPGPSFVVLSLGCDPYHHGISSPSVQTRPLHRALCTLACCIVGHSGPPGHAIFCHQNRLRTSTSGLQEM
jgi:hypothetical protein